MSAAPAFLLLVLAVGSPETRPTHRVAAWSAQARMWTLSGRWDDAVRLLEREIAAAVKRRERTPEARLRTELARVLVDRNFFHRRDRAGARAALDRASAAAKRADDPQSQADLTQYLGQLVYSDAFATKDWETPRRLFQEALAAREKLRDDRGMAESYFCLGLTYEQPGQPDTALVNYRRALFLAQEVEDPVLESYAHRHIGGIQEERGELDAAERSIRRSVELRRRAGWTVAVPFALLQLADFLERRRNDPQQAVRHLEEAANIAEESRSTWARAAARDELARMALAKGDARTALEHAEAALAAAKEFGDPERIRQVEKRVAEARGKAAA